MHAVPVNRQADIRQVGPEPDLSAARTDGVLVVLDRVRHLRRGESARVAPAVRVVIADGQALVRAGVRALLTGHETIAVVGEAPDGDEIVALARRTRPDVVLMGADLPGLDCVEATRRIRAEADVAVILLTAPNSADRMFDAVRAGASGLLLNDTEPAELVRAIKVVARGDALLAPSLTRRLLTEFAARPEPSRPSAELLEQLTAREREVVALVALGLNNDEIAERLVVSPATAKTHVSRAMIKLQARDRAQLVVFAYETGLALPRTEAPAPAPLRLAIA